MARLGRSRHYKPLVRVQRIVEPNLYPASIDTAEDWGTPSLSIDIASTGIVSAEAFGTPIIALNGIVSAEAFGTPIIVIDISPVGIESGLVFGNHFIDLSQSISLTGIPSAEEFGNQEFFDHGLPLPPLTQPVPNLPNPVVFENDLQRGARTAMGAAQAVADIAGAAPTDILVTIYDKIYKTRGECNDYLSLQAAFPRHLVESGELVIKSDDPLAEAALMCREEVVPVTIEIGHLLWSGRIKVAKDRFGWENETDRVICELEGDRAWLMKIMAWPNFLLPIQVQFPPRGVAIGPAISIIRWMIATQTFRLQAGLWDLINNLGSLNLDWRSWFGTFLMQDVLGADGRFDFSDIMRMLRTPIYVCKTNLVGALGGVLGDTSTFISINWRMDKMYELIDQIVKDNGLVVEVNLWRPGDPQPDNGMLFPLTVPTIVVDVKDRMDIVGPTGTFFDGILRTVIDLQDSIFGEITKPFLNPGGEFVPEGFNIAPTFGLHFVPPWVMFMADHPQSGCWGEIAHHHPLAWRTIIGGKCVSAETLVHTEDGLLEAKTLEGQEVQTLSQGGIYRLARWKSYGVQRLYKVTFVNGDEIFTTAHHEWVVTDRNDRIATTDLVGEYIPIVTPLGDSGVSVRVAKVEATDRIETVYCCEEPVTNTWVAGGGYLTGNSPKWMNDLMNAFWSFILDMIMIVIGLTGIPSNLFEGLFNDVLLAFQLADNMTRRLKLGPYGYPEWFAPTGQAPYNIDAIFALKREMWNTRGYSSAIVNFENGYPYDVGRDLFEGSLATVIRRGKVYTDFVENIVVTDTREKLSVEVQIGDGQAEEPASVKTYRNIVKFQEAINILMMSTQ